MVSRGAVLYRNHAPKRVARIVMADIDMIKLTLTLPIIIVTTDMTVTNADVKIKDT
jgi:hypothetical protein